MAQDRNGNNHKAAGRPDGGQFDKKAGQGSDDDLDFEAADTRLSAAMPDMDAEDRRRLIDVVIGGLDEDDPVAVAGYLDSLDPGVRFILSDKARALEARTLDDPDWCDAHAEELMAAVPDIGSGALTGVIHYWRADDPDASDRLAEAVTDDPDIADELCYERAVSDRLFRQRKPWASRDRLLGNPHLTEAQRSALTTPIPESGFTRANDPKNTARHALRVGRTVPGSRGGPQRRSYPRCPGVGGPGPHRPVGAGARIHGLRLRALRRLAGGWRLRVRAMPSDGLRELQQPVRVLWRGRLRRLRHVLRRMPSLVLWHASNIRPLPVVRVRH